MFTPQVTKGSEGGSQALTGHSRGLGKPEKWGVECWSGRQLAVLAATVLTLLVANCGWGQDNGNVGGRGYGQALPAQASAPYVDITVDELRKMMADERFRFGECPRSLRGGHSRHRREHQFDEIGQNLDQLPADRDAQIVLYCRSGRMSEEAARSLASLGFTNVFNLQGGFRAWEAAGSRAARGVRPPLILPEPT